MQYYEDVQYIALVDKNDIIHGKIERWNAHMQGALHRALTIAIYVKDEILLQKRKHPVFDSVYDITISTHQKYEYTTLQSDEETIYQTLQRELLLQPDSIKKKPRYMGEIIYQASDPKSNFIEHEVCHIYTCSIDFIPNFNPEFAYEIKTHKLDTITDQKQNIYSFLAPWVYEMIKKDMV